MRTYFVTLSLLLVMVLISQDANGQDPLRILNPSAGAKYLPGTVIPVDVACSDPSAIEEVIVALGEAHEGPLPCVAAMKFSILIPANMKVGSYNLIAAGSKGSGQGLAGVAKPVAVGITSAVPTRLIAQDEECRLPYVGARKQIILSGEFGGEVRSVMEDPSVQAQILDTAVATVDGNLFVTARQQGTTMVLVKYVDAANGRSVSIPIPVIVSVQRTLGDLDGDGDVDTDDLNLLRLYSDGSSASAPGDARDLNRDNKIDALDLRVLTTLCTRSRCANR